MSSLYNYRGSVFHRTWFRRSNIPTRFEGWGVESYGKYPSTVRQWLADVLAGENIKVPGALGQTGVGLLLSGPPGLGKTTLACSVLQDFIWGLNAENAAEVLRPVNPNNASLVKATPIYYVTYPELIALIKKGFDQYDEEATATLDGLYGRSRDDSRNVRVLVLDDLGKEHSTEFTRNIFYDLTRGRYDKGFPTIITTNLTERQWQLEYGDAQASFAKEAFEYVAMRGEDRRGR